MCRGTEISLACEEGKNKSIIGRGNWKTKTRMRVAIFDQMKKVVK